MIMIKIINNFNNHEKLISIILCEDFKIINKGTNTMYENNLLTDNLTYNIERPKYINNNEICKTIYVDCSIGPKKFCIREECNNCLKKSFASNKLSEFWHKDNKLQPRMVPKKSNCKFKFGCVACNHDFESRLSNISIRGTWCPYCAGKKLCEDENCDFCLENSFKSKPQSDYWSDENKVSPREVMKSSSKEYKFKCKLCDHTFSRRLSRMTDTSFCPFCVKYGGRLCDDNCKICYEKSFATHKYAIYWSNNNNISADRVHKFSNSKAKFNCFNCSHEFESLVFDVSNGSWCPYCAHKILCDSSDCDFCLANSFASNIKSKFWSKDNNISPRSVLKSSGAKFKFDCCDCNLTFEAALCNVSCGYFCPHCRWKTEKILLKFLSENHIVIHQKKFEWTLKENGSYMRYDFYIEKYKILIELDGAQHFRQVSCWTSPEITKNNDIIKNNLAVQNGYSIVRLLQEDVYYNKFDWKSALNNELYEREKKSAMVFICRNDEYADMKSENSKN